MTDSETKPERPKPDPKALSPEYHKARKQLMLWSAILFIWELVGIDLEKAQEAGGNAGALIKSIKSPQAIPWALVILVGYFAFKLRVEWRQCSEARRQVREAKQDYQLGFVVAASACILYFAQTLGHVQIADRLGNPGIGVLAVIVLLTWLALIVKGVWAFVRYGLHKRQVGWLPWLQLLLALLLALLPKIFVPEVWSHDFRLRILLIYVLIAAILLSGPWLYSLIQKRKRA